MHPLCTKFVGKTPVHMHDCAVGGVVALPHTPSLLLHIGDGIRTHMTCLALHGVHTLMWLKHHVFGMGIVCVWLGCACNIAPNSCLGCTPGSCSVNPGVVEFTTSDCVEHVFVHDLQVSVCTRLTSRMRRGALSRIVATPHPPWEKAEWQWARQARLPRSFQH